MSHATYEDEDYFVPLEDQRVFGAGIKRKRVPFVRASDDLQTTSKPPSREVRSVADIYSSIVMPKKHKKNAEHAIEQESESASSSNDALKPSASLSSVTSLKSNDELESRTDAEAKIRVTIAGTSDTDLCEICNLPVTIEKSEDNQDEIETTSSITARNAPHEASIVHQVCLQHSHPPSHLDRTRHGLRYLASYGWDPDSRTGLGVEGRTGILQPIKPITKLTTSGLGLETKDEEIISAKKKLHKAKQEERQKLNAKQVRLAHMADKKKGEKLRELFYASDDIQRYLGGGA